MFVQSFTLTATTGSAVTNVCTIIHTAHCRDLGLEAKALIWERKISSTEAIRRAQELVNTCRTLPKSAATSKKWVNETFGSEVELLKSVMALHMAIFTCSWRATSGVENVFNVFKKYKKGLLKRSVLYDAVMELLEMVQRRLQNDCILLQNHKDWFIDKRAFANAKKDKKKKLSTRQLFEKELLKLQDGSCCPWSECIEVPDKKMWLLSETVAVGDEERQILHLVDLNGFVWEDTEDNVPPQCHTCPCYKNGRIPCIGILTVLQNLKPLIGPCSIKDWLSGKGLERPELFHKRWRVDKDPTLHLSNYLLAPRVTMEQRHKRQPANSLHVADSLIPADLSKKYEDQLQRTQGLNPLSKAAALVQMNKVLAENEKVLARFELDDKIHKMTKSPGLKRQSIIDIRQGHGPRFPQTGAQSSEVAKAKKRGAESSKLSVAKRQKPAGTSDKIPEEYKWTCIVCNRGVLNDKQSVEQHCEGSTHKKNTDKWLQQTPQPNWSYTCPTCNFTFVENDPREHASKIRQHIKIKHKFQCDVCNVEIPNTFKARNDHLKSSQHQTQRMLQGEQHRDGPQCAANQRQMNAEAAKTATKRSRPANSSN
jgi:hypothetical protein